MYSEMFKALAADQAKQTRLAESMRLNTLFWQTGDEKTLDALLDVLDLMVKDQGQTWARGITREAFLATYKNHKAFQEDAAMKRLGTALNAWLDADGGWKRGDARLYSKQEWKDRGETVGRESALTLVIDGSPLYAALNYGEPSWKLQEELDAIAAAHGYYAELGYAWSIHFYKK